MRKAKTSLLPGLKSYSHELYCGSNKQQEKNKLRVDKLNTICYNTIRKREKGRQRDDKRRDKERD